jgi:hypothetical protein
MQRILDNDLWNWQWNLLLDRSVGHDWPLNEIVAVHRRAWPVEQPFRAHIFRDSSLDHRTLLLPRTLTRMRIVPLFSSAREPFELDFRYRTNAEFGPLNWTYARNFGIVTRDAESISFEVIIERLREDAVMSPRGRYPDEAWIVLRTRALHLPVSVGGHIDDYVQYSRSNEISATLAERVAVSITSSDVTLFLEDSEEAKRRYPVSVQLLRDGQMVLERIGWLGARSDQWSTELPTLNLLAPFGSSDYPERTWLIRIIGVPELALLDPESLFAWDGEFVMPLRILQTHERLFLVPDRDENRRGGTE